MAYKDIRQVMAAQEDLVAVVAEFQPRMVRMAKGGKAED
jgi:tRNA-splicing ligase RtcB